MPVDSCAFVKPAFSQSGVNTHGENIFATEIGKVGDVKRERRVTAEVFTDVETIENHHSVSKCAVELERNALGRIRLGKFKNTAVPADTCFGKIAAKRFASVILQFGVAREADVACPICRQLYRF